MYIHPYYFIVFDHVIMLLNVEILFVSACTLTTFVFSENRSSVHAADSSHTNPHKTSLVNSGILAYGKKPTTIYK